MLQQAAIALALRDKLCVSSEENEKQKENRTKYEYTNCKGPHKKIVSCSLSHAE